MKASYIRMKKLLNIKKKFKSLYKIEFSSMKGQKRGEKKKR